MKLKTFDLIQHMKNYPYWKFFLKGSKLFFNPFLHTRLFKARISTLDAIKMDAYLAQDNKIFYVDASDATQSITGKDMIVVFAGKVLLYTESNPERVQAIRRITSSSIQLTQELKDTLKIYKQIIKYKGD